MPLKLEQDPKNVFFRCVEDSGEAIMISDVKGKLVYVNPAWCRIYGYTREEAIGQTPRLLHSGHQSDDFYQKMWSQIRDPEIAHWKGELINRSKAGALIPVLLTITPFRSEAGEVNGYMGIAIDITQRRELEAKIVHQDRLASIGMLASGLAHEVGTPLGVVRGRAELLMMQAKDPGVLRNLEVIVSQADRISKLIRSLLRVSRNFSDVKIDDVSLEEVIQEILSLVGQNLTQEGIQIKIEVPSGLKMRADFSRVEQVLLNLVMNAFHAMKKAHQGGSAGPHALTLSAETRHRKIAFSVRDTGCGIPPENMKKLFRPFFTTKDIGEGTGLGLAIVAQLLQEMGGEISVASEVSVGTTFTMVFDCTGSE